MRHQQQHHTGVNVSGSPTSSTSTEAAVTATTTSGAAMVIDPIDDGPAVDAMSRNAAAAAAKVSYSNVPPTYSTAGTLPQQQPPPPPPPSILMITDEEARQYIDWLRSDDVAGRVAAANRIDAVAMALGKERTRTVREYRNVVLGYNWTFYISYPTYTALHFFQIR
jgi:hypothetical protein